VSDDQRYRPGEPQLPPDDRHIRISGTNRTPPPREDQWLRPETPQAYAEPSEPDGAHIESDAVLQEPGRRRRRRRRWPIVVPAIALLLLLVAFVLYSWFLWGQVETIATEGSLSDSGDGYTNYLIVGTDSRAGLSADLDSSDSIGLGVAGERSDTMVVLHTGGNGNHMVSLPRDLWVQIDGGSENKLNAARPTGGAPSLIRTVIDDPGIPIHSYLEVDIAGFLSIIDAVGSITVQFDRPACDPKSGLDVRSSGVVALGPEEALAYVRSRTYTEFDAAQATGLSCRDLISAGLGTTVGNSDFGRTERQRTFLLAVFDRVAGTRNPLTVLRVLDGLTDGLKVDDSMSVFDAFTLLRTLRGLNAVAHALPVSDFVAPNGSSALSLNSESASVLDLFRTGVSVD
jgi:LCP family protein required for cell wall assembly